MNQTPLITLCLLLAFGTLVPSVGASSSDDIERDAFVGITKVKVLVEDISDPYHKLNLTKEDLAAMTELHLRRNGVSVADSNDKEFPPTAYVNVNLVYIPRLDHFVYNVSLFLTDRVTRRDGQIVYGAKTWWDSATGIIPAENVRPRIKETLEGLLINFCNTYLASNPTAKN